MTTVVRLALLLVLLLGLAAAWHRSPRSSRVGVAALYGRRKGMSSVSEPEVAVSQPIVVRPGEDHVQLLEGDRQVRALKRGKGRPSKDKQSTGGESTYSLEVKMPSHGYIKTQEELQPAAELTPEQRERRQRAIEFVDANPAGKDRAAVLFSYADEEAKMMQGLKDKKQVAWNEMLAKMQRERFERQQALQFDRLSSRGKKEYLQRAERAEGEAEDDAEDDDDSALDYLGVGGSSYDADFF